MHETASAHWTINPRQDLAGVRGDTEPRRHRPNAHDAIVNAQARGGLRIEIGFPAAA
jgi:hypothetical protein